MVTSNKRLILCTKNQLWASCYCTITFFIPWSFSPSEPSSFLLQWSNHFEILPLHSFHWCIHCSSNLISSKSLQPPKVWHYILKDPNLHLLSTLPKLYHGPSHILFVFHNRRLFHQRRFKLISDKLKPYGSEEGRNVENTLERFEGCYWKNQQELRLWLDEGKQRQLYTYESITL